MSGSILGHPLQVPLGLCLCPVSPQAQSSVVNDWCAPVADIGAQELLAWHQVRGLHACLVVHCADQDGWVQGVTSWLAWPLVEP